jgi:hypothetical protein
MHSEKYTRCGYSGGSENTVSLISYNEIIKHVNPAFVIRNIKSSTFNFNVIDEGVLIGGSKQRVIPMILSQIDKEKIIYAGPSTGYAQVALSYICKMMNKQAILFLDCTKYDNSPLTDIAIKFGAIVNYFNPKIKAKRLKYIQNQAEVWGRNNKDSYMLPFGLNDDITVKLYSNVFSKLNYLSPKRLWIVAGSGLIFTALSKVFTKTKFMIIQVGKKVWPDQLEGINHQLFVSPYRFKENINESPPYDTLLNYDAKLWPFVLKYGMDGDYIWNTASNPKKSCIYDNELDILEKMKTTYKLPHIEIPKHVLEMSSTSDMFDLLSKSAKDWKHSPKVHRNFTKDYYNIDGISNHFTEEERMKCVVNRGAQLSPIEFFEKFNRKIGKKYVFLYGHNHGENINKQLLETTSLINGYRECNTFNPFILINFIKRYFKDYKDVDLLDPSMGWGDRLLACLSLGIKSYTGFDPNKDLHTSYNNITNLNTKTKTKFIPDIFSKKSLTHKYDIAFTSPPFYDLELYKYSEESVSGSYNDWLNNMYIPYLEDMMFSIKSGGYVGVYIDNIGRYKTGDDTNKILKSKLKFVEKLVFQNDHFDFNGVLHSGRPRSLWVYKK